MLCLSASNYLHEDLSRMVSGIVGYYRYSCCPQAAIHNFEYDIVVENKFEWEFPFFFRRAARVNRTMTLLMIEMISY